MFKSIKEDYPSWRPDKVIVPVESEGFKAELCEIVGKFCIPTFE
eukprot:CAMPEP_0202976204 /NCGR_PEP_ID=MMETSP1396-20130829/75385_1 /ASSEMBLY_ACC=CAM_ASM_000872 /TAXON_ID= /ORGANISM="Pseudokeronopsis sp., Strain Brazil" /LENGTH=43 /DNA_ID= /DNA_START= /DNA_END= /DNA_ORIENTATION=